MSELDPNKSAKKTEILGVNWEKAGIEKQIVSMLFWFTKNNINNTNTEKINSLKLTSLLSAERPRDLFVQKEFDPAIFDRVYSHLLERLLKFIKEHAQNNPKFRRLQDHWNQIKQSLTNDFGQNLENEKLELEWFLRIFMQRIDQEDSLKFAEGLAIAQQIRNLATILTFVSNGSENLIDLLDSQLAESTFLSDLEFLSEEVKALNMQEPFLPVSFFEDDKRKTFYVPFTRKNQDNQISYVPTSLRNPKTNTGSQTTQHLAAATKAITTDLNLNPSNPSIVEKIKQAESQAQEQNETIENINLYFSYIQIYEGLIKIVKTCKNGVTKSNEFIQMELNTAYSLFLEGLKILQQLKISVDVKNLINSVPVNYPTYAQRDLKLAINTFLEEDKEIKVNTFAGIGLCIDALVHIISYYYPDFQTRVNEYNVGELRKLNNNFQQFLQQLDEINTKYHGSEFCKNLNRLIEENNNFVNWWWEKNSNLSCTNKLSRESLEILPVSLYEQKIGTYANIKRKISKLSGKIAIETVQQKKIMIKQIFCLSGN